jgi:hypothetical protein
MLDRKDRREALFVMKNVEGDYILYINKKHWNKGDKTKGCLRNDITEDYLTYDYLRKNGYRFFVIIRNSRGHIEIRKSWNSKNHLVRRNRI